MFQYKDSRWPLVIGENDYVVQRIKDYYNLSINAAVMFQIYSETWSEWVDVKVMEILDKDKIRVAVP